MLHKLQKTCLSGIELARCALLYHCGKNEAAAGPKRAAAAAGLAAPKPPTPPPKAVNKVAIV